MSSAPKTPLYGTEPEDPIPFEHGVWYTLRLKDFNQTNALVQSLLPNLAVVLETQPFNIIVEQHPDYPHDSSVLKVTHITKSPIKETVYFDRPRHNNGWVLLGPHADGIGNASVRVYTSNSMWSISKTGGTGSGKSRGIEIIVITVRDPTFPPTVVWYMDGQNGASSPLLYKNADWAVGQDRAFVMLDSLEAIAQFRQRENRAYGYQGFTPMLERPGIFVVVDEHHRIYTMKGAAERFANAVLEWRKLGISFLSADQDTNVQHSFGGQDRLRTGLLEGNCVVMRVTSRIAGNLIPGLDINPFDLPRIPGYGFMVMPAESGARTAPFRYRYAPSDEDAKEAARKGRRLTVPTTEQWFERLPALRLDQTDRNAARVAGEQYLRRHEIAEAERAELLAQLNDPDGFETLSSTLVVPTGSVGKAAPEAAPNGASKGSFGFGNLAAAKLGAASAKQASARDAILALSWPVGEEWTTARIKQELKDAGHDLSDTAVAQALTRLCKDGPDKRLTRLEKGRYERTAQ